MGDTVQFSVPSVVQARKRRLVAMWPREIEGDPLGRDQVAMLEMFERNAYA